MILARVTWAFALVVCVYGIVYGITTEQWPALFIAVPGVAGFVFLVRPKDLL